ncbi:MAG: cobyrinate a,c-diamide synthase [Desulfocapsaceae bacterium]|nr:cobyrinate a,c-diamide synthase [Desulfocapsaceae bacterium]
MSRRAILIAGTHSGSGKTTVTLGMMAALKKLGHSLVPFKCGPDFIDPSLHRLVTGSTSRNLDLWMMGESFTKECFLRHADDCDIAVVEGVMGMFDGGPASSAALAKALGIPLILVLDVRSAAESGAAVLKGFETLDPDIKPQGVILNMVGSSRHYHLVRTAIEKYCRAEVLGYLPRTLDFSIPSRHLGLHMGEESPITADKIDALAHSIIEHIDMDRLLTIANISDSSGQPLEPHTLSVVPKVRLGVARDKAFCFYYEDNFDLLRKAGAEICFFSPLEDAHLPDGIDAIYLGGGYPELYGEVLSRNHSLLQEISTWAEDGKPIYAECGGFMYLTRGITDLDTNFHELAGVFPTQAAMQTKRASLGYREITTRTPSFFGPAGTVLRGHEFHYSNIEPLSDSSECVYNLDNGATEGYRYKNTLGGYMHLHFGFNPEAARNFIHFCSSAKKE